MLAAKVSTVRAAVRPAPAKRAFAPLPARNVAARALDDTNFALNVLASGLCISIPAAITTITSADREKEIERIQTVEGAAPIAAALAADAVVHSIPGINLLTSLLSEPLGAACGVAYLMTLVLSSPAVDPTTLAPEGTVLNAKTAADSRAAIRVPFTRIIPTAIKVVDTTNDSSSGAGWTIGENGLPKLPLNSVLLVLGVGGVIVELLAHAPVLSFFFPRVLQTAFWLAAAGYGLGLAGFDKRE